MSRLLSYYVFMGLAGVLGIGKGLVLVTILGIEGFGAYGLAMVLGAAFQFAIGLGSIEGLNVVLPKHLASGRDSEVSDSVLATARMIVARAVVAMLFSSTVFIIIGHESLAIAPLIGLSSALTTVTMVVARCQGNLRGFGLRMFLKGLATLSLAAGGGWIAGIHGAVIGEFLGAIVALLATWDWRRRFAKLSWHNTVLRERELRASGWPLLIQGVNGVAQQNIERWSVAATLGLVGAGQYGFAQLFVTAINLIHATFFQQAGSHVLPQLAAGRSTRQVSRQLLRFGSALGGGTLLVLIALSFYANDMLSLVLPTLGELTWGLIWLGGGAVAQMLHYFDWILIGCDRQSVIERISWLSTLLAIVMFGFGFVLNQSLEYFLFSYFIGRLFVLVATFGTAWKISKEVAKVNS